ncbi:PAS domain S-box-containing protein [Desulfitispora alkaliphila]|uniref:sigma 54-interacting transcriptional regulator n=1 Tax=Desulfitispora alkaliphila TaxID=622674 RepID=UPI003D1EA86E
MKKEANISQLDRYIVEQTNILGEIHSMILAINHEGKIIVYNEVCEKAFGHIQTDVIGKDVLEIVPITILKKVVKTGSSYIGRRFNWKGRLYVSNSTPVIREGQVIGAVGVAQEITELNSKASELSFSKEFEKELETILEVAYDGILVLDVDGTITYINKNFAKILNLEQREVIGNHITEVIQDSKLPLIVTEGNELYGDVIKIKSKELVISSFPIIRNGKKVGAVAKVIFKDVNQLIQMANKVNRLNEGLDYYKGGIQRFRKTKYGINNIIASSKEMVALKNTIKRVAKSSSTILIRGESGTGKELFAHALHQESNRSNGPFVKVNCAALPENLLESELFGYKEGAFTGARKSGQVGKFELAHGGTIFLDEIGDMMPAMQVKLLRVLQEKEIEPLGSGRSKKVDVRVVSATNRNLEELINEGKFREDLYYRLNVVTLNVPPLRKRYEDIENLVNYFIKKLNNDFQLTVKGLTPEVWGILKSHHWPGNIRELENVIERSFNVIEGDLIKKEHLPMYLQKTKPLNTSPNIQSETNLKKIVEEAERQGIINALKVCKGNKAQAASLLEISRAWLYQRMAKYNIKD